MTKSKKISIEFKDLRILLVGEVDYPKYSRDLMNLANRFSQGTRPKVVGQMSELMKEWRSDTKDRTFESWKTWYLKRYPEAVSEATKKVRAKLSQFDEVLSQLSEETVRNWVEHLVITDSYVGLNLERPIIEKIAYEHGKQYRASTPSDESKGIDGYIGSIPISVKPATYKLQKALIEKIKGHIIYYDKEGNTVTVEIPEALLKLLES